MKIVIAGEVYSSNLGDRIIYDNLRYLFQNIQPGIQVEALDLSGRSPIPTSAQAQGKRLSWIRRVENSTPGLFSLLNALLQLRTSRKRSRNDWPGLLQDAEALVIGGGQLLQDNQLGFPLKLYWLAREAKRRQLPLFISACGVGAGWSPIARRLFSFVLHQARSITVRDPLSMARLENYLPGIKASVTFDPAIWSEAVYGRPAQPETATIGMGVINPLDVNLHLGRKQRFSENEWVILWSAVLKELENKHIPVELFSNGSPLDQQFAEKLAGHMWHEHGINIRCANRPTSAVELVQTITRYRGIAAFRMHANILADAYRQPCIGLVWDQKVRAYYEMRGYPERYLDLGSIDPQGFVNFLQAAIEEGVEENRWQQARARAQISVEKVLSDLSV